MEQAFTKKGRRLAVEHKIKCRFAEEKVTKNRKWGDFKG